MTDHLFDETYDALIAVRVLPWTESLVKVSFQRQLTELERFVVAAGLGGLSGRFQLIPHPEPVDETYQGAVATPASASSSVSELVAEIRALTLSIGREVRRIRRESLMLLPRLGDSSGVLRGLAVAASEELLRD